MYSERVTQQQVERVEAASKLSLYRHPVADVLSWVPQLTRIWNNGTPTRPWTGDEARFIRNEQVLCKLDFHYWAERYCQIIKDGVDGGGLGTLNLWESQWAILRLIAKLEEKAWEAFERVEPVDGILIALNKARQLGATMISRSIIMHRTSTWDHQRGFSASVDDDKILELYDRDKRIYDNLPFYLRPSLRPDDGSFDTKAGLIRFGLLDSSILYQTANQKSGLGQGRQFEVAHFTEAASFPYPRMLEHDFFPTIPQSPYAFCLAESTPQGRGNWWHLWTEKVRMGRMARWAYLFVPVYIERKKYRRQPPADWIPSELTLQYARKVEDTSPEIIGSKFTPSRDHLYWYESTRQEYQEMGSLSIFLTNYAATPAESFQHSTGAAVNPELLDYFSLHDAESVNYEFAGVRH